MYRTTDNGRLGFNGVVEWALPKGGSVFTVSARERLEDGSEGFMTIKAVFSQAHSKHEEGVPSQDELRKRFKDFNEDETRAEQFKLIYGIWCEIWEACHRVYGAPYYTIEVKDTSQFDMKSIKFPYSPWTSFDTMGLWLRILRLSVAALPIDILIIEFGALRGMGSKALVQLLLGFITGRELVFLWMKLAARPWWRQVLVDLQVGVGQDVPDSSNMCDIFAADAGLLTTCDVFWSVARP
ncbi:uncharacterized protein CDV56_101163 [Aspergillus thermomutatus]|uniref:Uncharacterized protein n=1 Tax=Aspergillus thermomutatus TaxID=41047 RepID=A0A397GQ76_ASPTH|nr:uncharacterized protein CDV56_101163 [Aspergillus thermomutatus]RHZ50190.1 hypothetical protein CDV56_101163 [Aspergillus thermomutatus]